MSDRAAFHATYSDWRVIKGRKVVQIVFEVPIEAENQAYEVLGGMPNPAESVWCAVARLDLKAMEVASHKPPPPTPSHDILSAGARDTRLTQRAGILCGDQEFRSFLCDEFDLKSCNAEGAAETVRLFCSVESRRDIIVGTPAGDRFEQLLRKFAGWKACIDA